MKKGEEPVPPGETEPGTSDGDATESARPPKEPPPVTDSHTGDPEHHRGVVFLLSAAAVLAAIVGARASIVAADASTAWQEGTRAKVKEAAAYVETIRYIYGVEVPRAVLVTEIRFRIDELSKIPKAETFSNATQRAIAVEKETQEAVLDQISSASVLGTDPQYRTPDGFDPVQMLIDDRESLPELLEVDPHHDKAEGDRKGDQAIDLISATIPIAFAFLCGSLARGFPRRRRIWLIAGGFFLVVAVVWAISVQVA
jgi:hypothetical protein